MRKTMELTQGCMAKALPDEMTFVLLSRDAAASATIRFWIAERLRLGKNQPTDAQIVEAEYCAQRMEQEGRLEDPLLTLATVFSRPECVFVFCPSAVFCKERCLSPSLPCNTAGCDHSLKLHAGNSGKCSMRDCQCTGVTLARSSIKT